MKILCVFGKFQYGQEARGLGTEYASFLPALKRLGHEVALFDSWNKESYPSLAELNAALLSSVDQEKPDVLLYVPMLYDIWLETLQIIRREIGVTTICWTPDDSWKYEQQSRFLAPHFDAITTTYPAAFEKYHRDGFRNVLLTQWAADASRIHPPLPASQCSHEVTFVGANHGNRAERVAALRRLGIEVECFGFGWPSGPVSADRMIEMYRSSVISLNFANSIGDNQIKARTFEVPGAGGFLISEHSEGIERFYKPGEEIESFRSVEELAGKIRTVLGDPSRRDAIAAAGNRRTASEHTYDARLREVLEFARQQRAENNQRSITTVTSFAEACERHRLNVPLRMFRWLLLGATQLIWGRTRGRRAARRVAFEMSWRLTGGRTFAASSIPGRLFPRD